MNREACPICLGLPIFPDKINNELFICENCDGEGSFSN